MIQNNTHDVNASKDLSSMSNSSFLDKRLRKTFYGRRTLLK